MESDFREFGLKPPEKITFKESYRIFESNGRNVLAVVKFLPEFNEGNSDDEHYEYGIEVLKIRENLFVKLKVEYLIY